MKSDLYVNVHGDDNTLLCLYALPITRTHARTFNPYINFIGLFIVLFS